MAKQLTFNHLAAQRRRPRPVSRGACAVARAERQRIINAAATGHNAPRAREIARIKRELHAYLRARGVRARFQASEFIEYLHEVGCPPDRKLVDPRCTGGMFIRLVNQKHLRIVGHRCNKGNKHTGYGSTDRPVYVIARLPKENDS